MGVQMNEEASVYRRGIALSIPISNDRVVHVCERPQPIRQTSSHCGGCVSFASRFLGVWDRVGGLPAEVEVGDVHGFQVGRIPDF